VRAETHEASRDAAKQIENGQTNGNLASHTKDELLELASALDLEGRSAMSKQELVKAIKRQSKETSK
jgi:hypothetical protein